MKLIKPSANILTLIDEEEILKQIELAARTCYQSEEKIEYAPLSNSSNEVIGYKSISARFLIYKLISLGHEAMLEFGSNITVRFIVDRGISHELVRHRIASFAQESTRYCNYSKNEHISFIIPCFTEHIVEGIDDNHYLNYNNTDTIWLHTMKSAELHYNQLLKLGWTAQQARSILPNSLKTEINISCNIREWRHIFKLRTSKKAHPQMREVMIPLLTEFKRLLPTLFNDIIVEE
jgi:thymidylate synthase (FAD)